MSSFRGRLKIIDGRSVAVGYRSWRQGSWRERRRGFVANSPVTAIKLCSSTGLPDCSRRHVDRRGCDTRLSRHDSDRSTGHHCRLIRGEGAKLSFFSTPRNVYFMFHSFPPESEAVRNNPQHIVQLVGFLTGGGRCYIWLDLSCQRPSDAKVALQSPKKASLFLVLGRNKTCNSATYKALWDVVRSDVGAGEGNRTLVFSLGSCCSTIELHPQNQAFSSTVAGRFTRRFTDPPSEAVAPLPRSWPSRQHTFFVFRQPAPRSTP
jgi:hypothetical protein